MRKTLIIAVGAAVALVTAAVAMAVVFTAAGVGPATATLTAVKASEVKIRTCKGGDGREFTITHGRYIGTAKFTAPATDPVGQLDGDLTIRAHTTYDTTSKLGYVEGSFRIKDDDTRTSGRFSGTLNQNEFVGYLTGASRGSHARVLGTLSGTFIPGTSFTATLGSGSITPLAVIAGPVCRGDRDHGKSDDKSNNKAGDKSAKPTRPLYVRGAVDKVGDNSVGSTITVKWVGPATVTCTRDATSPSTTGFAVGTKVEMKCEKVGTVWTLRELKAHT